MLTYEDNQCSQCELLRRHARKAYHYYVLKKATAFASATWTTFIMIAGRIISDTTTSHSRIWQLRSVYVAIEARTNWEQKKNSESGARVAMRTCSKPLGPLYCKSHRNRPWAFSHPELTMMKVSTSTQMRCVYFFVTVAPAAIVNAESSWNAHTFCFQSFWKWFYCTQAAQAHMVLVFFLKWLFRPFFVHSWFITFLMHMTKKKSHFFCYIFWLLNYTKDTGDSKKIRLSEHFMVMADYLFTSLENVLL